MEKSSLEINLPNSDEERKLYVVDSLNNLNKLNVCPDEFQRPLGMYDNVLCLFFAYKWAIKQTENTNDIVLHGC